MEDWYEMVYRIYRHKKKGALKSRTSTAYICEPVRDEASKIWEIFFIHQKISFMFLAEYKFMICRDTDNLNIIILVAVAFISFDQMLKKKKKKLKLQVFNYIKGPFRAARVLFFGISWVYCNLMSFYCINLDVLSI